MRVSDYMSKHVVCANLRDGLRQTFYRMRERGIRHMPVLGEHGELIGIISDRDLRRPDWVDDEPNVTHYYLLDNTILVEEAMTPTPLTIRVDADVKEALQLFLDHKYGALPVVNEAGKLMGILSAVDLLRAFRDVIDAA